MAVRKDNGICVFPFQVNDANRSEVFVNGIPLFVEKDAYDVGRWRNRLVDGSGKELFRFGIDNFPYVHRLDGYDFLVRPRGDSRDRYCRFDFFDAGGNRLFECDGFHYNTDGKTMTVTTGYWDEFDCFVRTSSVCYDRMKLEKLSVGGKEALKPVKGVSM